MMERRTFLLGLGASGFFAAPLARASVTTPQERFDQLAGTGVVEGEVFDTTAGGPLIVGNFNNLTIRNCRFIYNAGQNCVEVRGQGKILTIEGCAFEERGGLAIYAVQVGAVSL